MVAAVTDWLDGWLARRLRQTSSFGAFLDPVADKLMVTAALMILLQLSRINALVALVIVGREITISALREWMAQLGASRSVAVHRLGKIKTIAQMVAIPMLPYDDWFLFFDSHRVRHLADLGRRAAHRLVDGLLHAPRLPEDSRADPPQEAPFPAPRDRRRRTRAARPVTSVRSVGHAARCHALIPAAGVGSRMGSATPKQYLDVGGPADDRPRDRGVRGLAGDRTDRGRDRARGCVVRRRRSGS